MFNNFPLFPMPQFPFPQFPFPNFNFNPNFQPNYNQGNLPYPVVNNRHPMMPIPPSSPPMTIYIPPENSQQPVLTSKPNNSESSTINHRVVPLNNSQFSTNNFFENTDNRQWSVDQELQWQATTRKPFFENTVPGFLVIYFASNNNSY